MCGFNFFYSISYTLTRPTGDEEALYTDEFGPEAAPPCSARAAHSIVLRPGEDLLAELMGHNGQLSDALTFEVRRQSGGWGVAGQEELR